MEKDKVLEIQKRLDETFPIIASGKYVRDFEKSCICWPLNWGYDLHKPKEVIHWEYRSNSRRLPFFMYREKYSYTTVQVNFIVGHSNERQGDIGASYLDQDELTFNQEHIDTPQFKNDHLIVQPEVDEGDMLRHICKFDRKLSLALSSLDSWFEGKTPVKKIPAERLFQSAVEYLAIPLIAKYKCSGEGWPSREEFLKYASGIWGRIEF